MDLAVRKALADRLPIRVVMLEGTRRDWDDLEGNPSQVEKRALDPMPWAVTAYNEESGDFTLTRGATPQALHWWSGNHEERYWLEITGRDDVGTNLNAPQQGEDGALPHWSYSLIREIPPGDVVFHWHTGEGAIVGCSRAVGLPWADTVKWAARGTSARKHQTEPRSQPGWYLGLEGTVRLNEPVTAETLRNSADSLWALRAHLQDLHGDPVLFPFYRYGDGEVRAQQAYLAKFPHDLLNLFPQLTTAARLLDKVPGAVSTESPTKAPKAWGAEYRSANEQYSAAQRDPFAIDPALVERGLRGHAATQNALAEFVQGKGADPQSPQPTGPNFDLAWEWQGVVYVAEVKSLTKSNQEKQLRLGLGQVLRFRHMLEQQSGRPTVGVLALEFKPADDSWFQLCKALGIIIVWKDGFNALAASR